jgi:hypothetical protein
MYSLVHAKAVALVVGLIGGPPHKWKQEEGFVATNLFLDQNGEKMSVEHNPKILH